MNVTAANEMSPSGGMPATQWSVVLAAGNEQTQLRLAALETLCGIYWYPLYCFARRFGSPPEDARDLTQAFFANFLEKNHVTHADPSRGRFRTWLLTVFKNFVINEWKRARAARRGGDWQAVLYNPESAESRYVEEALTSATPDEIYDKTWSMEILRRAMRRLRDEYATANNAALYEHLKLQLWGECDGVSYARLAERLDLNEATVKTAMMRMRRRFRAAIRQEVEWTVEDPKDVDEEMRYLLSVLRA